MLAITEWLAESIRATNFPIPGVDYDPSPWWRRLLDQEPDTRIVRPAARELKEEGPFGEGSLALEVNSLGVIHWNLSPSSLKEIPAAFPTVGRFVDARDAFCSLVRRWFEVAPPLNRIAFGAVVLFPVAERPEGYRLLSSYLPSVQIDTEKSSDLLYQINRRRRSRSGIDRLEINRLSKWSVSQLRVSVQTIEESRAERVLPPLHACRVELDINTAPEYRDGLVHPRSSEIFDELIALANEILESGDRP